MTKKIILITGANTGLGYDLAKGLIKDRKIELIGLVNKKSPVKALLKKVKIIKLDLMNNNEILDLNLKFKNHQIDTIIHCAGGGLGYHSSSINLKKLNDLMQLNFYSIFEINKILINNKKKNKRLNIIHIGSLASTHSVASIGYSASKATLINYNKNLAYKFYKNKVFTKLLIPGSFISTGGSMQRLKKNKIKIFKNIENKLISKKLLTSKNLIPIIKFLSSKDSDILSGSILNAANLESLNIFS